LLLIYGWRSSNEHEPFGNFDVHGCILSSKK
jgi:hypothetical protein